MNEPDNLTAWTTRTGAVYVRVDDRPGNWGTWWETSGDGTRLGGSFEWCDVEPSAHAPYTLAGADLTTRVINLVRKDATCA